MLISFPPEGDQKSPSLRSGFWRANNVGSFFMSSYTIDEILPTPNQARKDKQALGLRPSFASLHQCLLVARRSRAPGNPQADQARKDKQAKMNLIFACLSRGEAKPSRAEKTCLSIRYNLY